MEFDAKKFLEKEVIPARGCTEPVAVALAVSLAYHALYEKLPRFLGGDKKEESIEGYAIPTPEVDRVKKIKIKVDRNVFKNSYAVYIPNTKGKKGLKIAAAMGLFCDPDEKLDLLKRINRKIMEKANNLVEQEKITIMGVENEEGDKPKLDIEVNLEYLESKGENIKTAIVRIQEKHSNITYIGINDVVLYKKHDDVITSSSETTDMFEKIEERFPDKISDLIKITQDLTPEERDEIHRGIAMNEKIAKEGLKNQYGLMYGRMIRELVEEGTLGDDLITEVKIQTGAAGDARMGGADIPVMSTAGSGNQGIAALIPIIVTSKTSKMNKDKNNKNKLIESVMLSHLVTKYVSNHVGHLSAICGCTMKAGIGAAAGLTYYLGGGEEQINNAINIMAANITGIICDGAKETCVLKLSTAVGAATESALLAMKGMKIQSDNGIISERAEDTIKNIGRISETMIHTDATIMDIIQSK